LTQATYRAVFLLLAGAGSELLNVIFALTTDKI